MSHVLEPGSITAIDEARQKANKKGMKSRYHWNDNATPAVFEVPNSDTSFDASEEIA